MALHALALCCRAILGDRQEVTIELLPITYQHVMTQKLVAGPPYPVKRAGEDAKYNEICYMNEKLILDASSNL